jgi:hypothetical protein
MPQMNQLPLQVLRTSLAASVQSIGRLTSALSATSEACLPRIFNRIKGLYATQRLEPAVGIGVALQVRCPVGNQETCKGLSMLSPRTLETSNRRAQLASHLQGYRLLQNRPMASHLSCFRLHEHREGDRAVVGALDQPTLLRKLRLMEPRLHATPVQPARFLRKHVRIIGFAAGKDQPVSRAFYRCPHRAGDRRACGSKLRPRRDRRSGPSCGKLSRCYAHDHSADDAIASRRTRLVGCLHGHQLLAERLPAFAPIAIENCRSRPKVLADR